MSEKTEDPTPKKIKKAREDGQVAKSKDFTQTVLIVALFGYMISNSGQIVEDLARLMLLPVQSLGLGFEAAADAVIAQLFTEAVKILVPFLLIVIVLGLFVELAQSGMLIAFKAMVPSGKKLNVISNVKNIVSIKNFVEFLKSTLKILFLGALLYFVIRDSLSIMLNLPESGLTGVGETVATLVEVLIWNVAIGYTILAAADYAFQRHQYIKGLMMSKDEVKQEFKESEGDAHIKHKRKHLHQEMLAEGAVHSSRKASVLVTNPTHLAIAILYEKESTPLPVVLAKGEGALAARMVAAAREAGVPVLQNIPLAHALMENAEIDQYIPDELIEPVAEVLKLIQGMQPDRE